MREIIAEIIKIKEETHDVRTFKLKLTNSIDFIPGQYCLVSIIGNKEPESEAKPFTFATSPTEKRFIELAIKKMGKFTAALHSLVVGDKLKIEGPQGTSLNFDETLKDDIVFLAGGSGITPFISAIRYAIAKKLPNRITLLFSNRTADDIIYKKEFDEISRNNRNIKIINTITQDAPKQWPGEKGRIDRKMIERYVKNPKEKLWYVCGPPPMVSSMKEMLLGMGVPENRLKIEDWQLPGKHDK